ncbi:MAG: hypothetical protein UDQ58_06710 [Desulfovibrio sp.]|nr:hypothetical protein [Schwartzia sp. (in: firmicutes)]MEE0406255.1 hypothetical protein [Desulfovibrio sp.]
MIKTFELPSKPSPHDYDYIIPLAQKDSLHTGSQQNSPFKDHPIQHSQFEHYSYESMTLNLASDFKNLSDYAIKHIEEIEKSHNKDISEINKTLNNLIESDSRREFIYNIYCIIGFLFFFGVVCGISISLYIFKDLITSNTVDKFLNIFSIICALPLFGMVSFCFKIFSFSHRLEKIENKN